MEKPPEAGLKLASNFHDHSCQALYLVIGVPTAIMVILHLWYDDRMSDDSDGGRISALWGYRVNMSHEFLETEGTWVNFVSLRHSHCATQAIRIAWRQWREIRILSHLCIDFACNLPAWLIRVSSGVACELQKHLDTKHGSWSPNFDIPSFILHVLSAQCNVSLKHLQDLKF